MKAQEKSASEMSDTELKQAIAERQEFARKQGGKAIIAFLASAALLVGAFAVTTAIVLYTCMVAASGGALFYCNTCWNRHDKGIREITPLWKEMNARAWAFMRPGLPSQLPSGPATQEEVKPVFGTSAVRKHGAKIPKLAPVKLTPVTNWN
jgi:hypothetical protein